MLKRPALYGSIIALGVAGAAHADSHDMAGMSPQSMTCADIAGMDESQAEGAIYFVAGYENAQGFDSAMGTTGAVTGVTGTAATADTGASASGTATTGAGTDTTAGVATGTTGTTGTGTDAGGSGMGTINFQDIQVSEILTACEDQPDQLVSAVLRDHMGGASSN